MELNEGTTEPLRRAIFGATSIFDLWSRPWGVARLLGLRRVPPRPHPSKGVGYHHHQGTIVKCLSFIACYKFNDFCFV